MAPDRNGRTLHARRPRWDQTPRMSIKWINGLAQGLVATGCSSTARLSFMTDASSVATMYAVFESCLAAVKLWLSACGNDRTRYVRPEFEVTGEGGVGHEPDRFLRHHIGLGGPQGCGGQRGWLWWREPARRRQPGGPEGGEGVVAAARSCMFRLAKCV